VTIFNYFLTSSSATMIKHAIARTVTLKSPVIYSPFILLGWAVTFQAQFEKNVITVTEKDKIM
jgi:hypothetical protein